MTSSRPAAPSPTREWVTVPSPADPDHVVYTFDVSFLLSDYQCVWGDGCRGIEAPVDSRAEAGCCVHGAYLTDDDDVGALDAFVRELTPATMAHHDLAVREGWREADDEGELHTRVVDGSCIFHNPEGSTAPTGCALHHLAGELGEDPTVTKPTVCWQLPLHRTIDEQTANDGGTRHEHRIAAFERGHWGEGGADFGWYCLEDPVAFTAARPLYRTMETELRLMVGDEVYDALATHLDARRRQHNVPRFLPLAGAPTSRGSAPGR